MKQENTQKLPKTRPAHLQIPDSALLCSSTGPAFSNSSNKPNCFFIDKASPAPAPNSAWPSPCSIIHGFPDSPVQSPAASPLTNPSSDCRSATLALQPSLQVSCYPNPNPNPNSTSISIPNRNASHNPNPSPSPLEVIHGDSSALQRISPTSGTPARSLLACSNPTSDRCSTPSQPSLLLQPTQLFEDIAALSGSSHSFSDQSAWRSSNSSSDHPKFFVCSALPRSEHTTSKALGHRPMAHSCPSSYSAPASPPPECSWYSESNTYIKEHAIFCKGTFVFVRCNQSKWLLGQIRRWAHGGVIVWVASVQVMVNVPSSLIPTHMVLFANPAFPKQVEGRHESLENSLTEANAKGHPHRPASCPSSLCPDLSAPPASDLVSQKFGHHHSHDLCLKHDYSHTYPGSSCRRAFFDMVRPAHLSHRRLYKPLMKQRHDKGSEAGQMKAFSSSCKDERSHITSPNNSSCKEGIYHMTSPNNSSREGDHLHRSLSCPIQKHLHYTHSRPLKAVKSDPQSSFASTDSPDPLARNMHVHGPDRWRLVPKPIATGLVRLSSLPPASPSWVPRPDMKISQKAMEVIGAKNADQLYIDARTEAQDTQNAEQAGRPDTGKVATSLIASQYSAESLKETQLAGKLQSLSGFKLENTNPNERKCKSLGFSSSSTEQQQVWYTVIENGLDTRKKKRAIKRTLTH